MFYIFNFMFEYLNVELSPRAGNAFIIYGKQSFFVFVLKLQKIQFFYLKYEQKIL